MWHRGKAKQKKAEWVDLKSPNFGKIYDVTDYSRGYVIGNSFGKYSGIQIVFAGAGPQIKIADSRVSYS